MPRLSMARRRGRHRRHVDADRGPGDASPSASTSWPAPPTRQANAASLAREAVTAVAEPAYRSSSLDEHGRRRTTARRRSPARPERVPPRRGDARRLSRQPADDVPTEGLPIVAIVGRPNVGKSTLFNRLVGERVAIVEDRARTTRDRLYDIAEWNGRRFIVVDTGGLEAQPGDAIEERVQEQARLAIAEADVIVLVVDADAGLTPADEEAVELLRTATRAGHRGRQQGRQPSVSSWRRPSSTQLGWEDTFAISALHGRGVADLLDAVVWALPRRIRCRARAQASRRPGGRGRRLDGEVRVGRLRIRRQTGAGGHRRPAQRRQELAAQRVAGRAAGDRVATFRARRATPSTRRSNGPAARSG